MKFRPCIDLHQGKVKQIVGSSLTDNSAESVVTNFVSQKPPSWYADLYKNDNLTGGHVIKLGPDNDQAALSALSTWPGGMQIGGGINDNNAQYWLDSGAAKVIVTSFVFENGEVNVSRLKRLSRLVGSRRLVLDLSCRKKKNQYFIATDRWQKMTNVSISLETLDYFAEFSEEFLIHAVDAEGKSNGIETALVELLGSWTGISVTYAGGIRNEADIELIAQAGNGKIDYTVGSALDIFGGTGLRYKDLINISRSDHF